MENIYRVHIIGKGWSTGSGWTYTVELDDFEETLDQLPDEEHQAYYFEGFCDDLLAGEPEELEKAAKAENEDVQYVVTLTPEDDPEEEPALIFSRWRSELAKELIG